jgi:hypothetical protein
MIAGSSATFDRASNTSAQLIASGAQQFTREYEERK